MPAEGMQNPVNMTIPAKGAAPTPNMESEEGRWYHYNEFVWVKKWR